MALVGDADGESAPLPVAGPGEGDGAVGGQRRRAVDDGVLHDGLEAHLGNGLAHQLQGDIRFQADHIVKAQVHQRHVVFDIVQLPLQAHPAALQLHAVAQQLAQGGHRVGDLVLLVDLRHHLDGLQHVVDEVGVDLVLESPQLGALNLALPL